jgi:glucose/mannose transport system substrate-binding protein
MYIHGDWVKGYYQAKGWHAGLDFAEVPAPGTAGNYLFNFDDFAIPANAQNPAAAKAFLSVLASKQGQIAFNGYKGSAPIRNDLDVTLFDTVEQQKIAELENPSTNLLPLSANSGDWGNETGCLIPTFRPKAAPSSNAATAQAAEDAAVDAMFAKMALCYSCDETGVCSPAQSMCFHMTKTCGP